MKFILARKSFADFINHNKIFSLIINSVLTLFLKTIRLINKQFAYNNGNIAVISLHRLGDTVFTIPAIREIQKFYNRKINLICFPESIPIYNLVFNNINYCEFEHDDFYFMGRIAKFKVKKKLKLLKPQIIIDLIGGMSSASLIFNSRAKEIIGINRELFSAIYDHFVKIRESPKLVDIYLDAISPFIHNLNRDNYKNYKKSVNPDGKILIHPFAGWKEKEWGLKNFIKLAEKFNNAYQVSIIIPFGQVDADVLAEIKNKQIEVVQTKSVEDLIHKIKDCSIFIGNDSGPINIANYIGKPTFTLYGATNPAYTATKNDHQIFIQKVLKCSARENEKFCIIGGAVYRCPGIQCMNSLTVEEVYEKVYPLVNQYCIGKEKGNKIN